CLKVLKHSFFTTPPCYRRWGKTRMTLRGLQHEPGPEYPEERLCDAGENQARAGFGSRCRPCTTRKTAVPMASNTQDPVTSVAIPSAMAINEPTNRTWLRGPKMAPKAVPTRMDARRRIT